MKKILVFSVITFSLFYILSEFVGDKIIKGVLETNISNVLDRETNIENLKINYRNGDAEIYGLQVKNKIFNGNLLNLDKAYLITSKTFETLLFILSFFFFSYSEFSIS